MSWDLEIPKAEAIAILQTIEARSVPSNPEGFGWEVEVKFRGQWLLLARTDWKDDVATGRYLSKEEAEHPEALVEEYRKACIRPHWGDNTFGARVRFGEFPCFAVIDRGSDG